MKVLVKEVSHYLLPDGYLITKKKKKKGNEILELIRSVAKSLTLRINAFVLIQKSVAEINCFRRVHYSVYRLPIPRGIKCIESQQWVCSTIWYGV